MFNTILVSERRGKIVYYRLSYDLFRVYIDGIRRKAKYYLIKNADSVKDDSDQ
jgi:DNA-binding transcriptional ArsR family regulator